MTKKIIESDGIQSRFIASVHKKARSVPKLDAITRGKKIVSKKFTPRPKHSPDLPFGIFFLKSDSFPAFFMPILRLIYIRVDNFLALARFGRGKRI